MTVQHIALVLGADGLTASEKLLLIAYCNHTDAHGYCWPGIARLADETGMSVRTIHRTNAALRTKGLVRSVRRVNPRTGESITNLTRINLALLASMQRPARDYGDSLVDEITVADQHTPSDLPMCQSDTPSDLSGTPSDLPMCQSDTGGVSNWHGGGVRLAPKTSIETSDEPPPPPVPLLAATPPQSAPEEEEEEEEEEATPERDTPTPAGGSRTSAATGDHGEAAALVAELPAIAARAGRPLTRALRADESARLAALVAAALARGWTADQIRAVLADDLRTARSPVATWHARLASLDAPPAPAAPAAPPKCDACNPYRWIEDDDGLPLGRCPTCHPSLAGSLAGRRSA